MSSNETGLFFDGALLPEGWATNVRAVVADGCFRSVTAGASPAPADKRHAVALPGMANLHSHAFQRGMAGLAERRGPTGDSFWTWRNVMYRFVDRLSPDQIRVIAAMAYVEMLETGFTRVGEFHYLHHAPDGHPYADVAETSAAIMAAAGEAGIALTHLPVLYAHSGFGGQVPTEGQRRFINDPDRFATLVEGARVAAASLPDAVVGIAPHSLRAVTPEELNMAVGLVADAPIHIHIAEQQREVDDCVAWGGARPVAWLLDHAPVDARWCLIHATHVDARETRRMAQSGAVAGLCPITEANLGDGLFPVGDFMAAGGRIGIGSDSNVLIDASEELRLLEYGQRLTLQQRNVLAAEAGDSTGRSLYVAAGAGGARALGVPSGIAPGCAADFLTLDTNHPGMCAAKGDGLLDTFLFAAGRSAIDCVWRRGVQVVSGGRHRDRDATARAYRDVIRALAAD
ncbi:MULTISPECIES: formimidoylglutamate deiminase [Alphaproteobacteria]|uniref:formimidoylglutamate deiminase n=1 Tax=Alphaproteobacteria TaxID=28211 RepID=UPI000DAF8FD3|nr:MULTISPECIES: formimidoylglutamate deiminase [Alphaproteobacteria]MBY0302729.1 formimidoylglutamate deiminase [Sphingomonas ginsenosidimutans]PZP65991.1 MAG: formimidoylglutamate deiminase [Methylorubrum populi]